MTRFMAASAMMSFMAARAMISSKILTAIKTFLMVVRAMIFWLLRTVMLS
ncbi:MAG: hypothetical protein P8P44_03225 [Alphaproteobacteria bacterium]|nr:hypothetical protein [Alphaproteobacteria bacterium]